MANAEEYAQGVVELTKLQLGIPREEAVAIDRKLSEYGVDSLDVMEIVMACEERWSIEINESDLPDDPTALDVAKKIVEQVGG